MKFIKENPNASEGQCFAFAAALFAEQGIDLRNVRSRDYKTGKLSGVKIPKLKLLDRLWPIVGRVFALANPAGELIAAAMLGYELFSIMMDVEMPIDQMAYINGIDAFERAKSLCREGKYKESRIESMKNCYYMGSLTYGMFSELSRFTLDLREAHRHQWNMWRLEDSRDLALKYLEKAYSIKNSLGYVYPAIPFELGKMYALTGNKHKASACISEAINEFEKEGETRMADEARSALNEID